jgi:cell division protein FtsL
MDYSKLIKYKHEKPDDENEQLADKNRPETVKVPSRLKPFLLVILTSLLVILYVSNVMKVKSLLREVYDLKKHSEKMTDGNHIINAKINELESAERITVIAREKFGMIKPNYPPVSLPRNNDTIK